jgi:uracil-DNA glycosylase family 4
MPDRAFGRLERRIIACHRCPRLVRWRRHIATTKTRRFSDWRYWGRPVPGFGDVRARLVLVGLAPAAHGANRTGRMFTGDRSGEWLYRSLHRFGFANQAESSSRNDGLLLNDCYVTAGCRCAPPENKPLPEELTRCRPFLIEEMTLLKNMRVVLGLGKIGHQAAYQVLVESGRCERSRTPPFRHGSEARISEHITLLASFHPSQQNTFTGRLSEPMFDAVIRRAREILEL